MNKKAQGLSLTVIVIGIIVLVVLVVLVFIFTGRTGKFSGDIAKCEARGGTCMEKSICNGPVDSSIDCGKLITTQKTGGRTWFSRSMEKVCCIKLGE